MACEVVRQQIVGINVVQCVPKPPLTRISAASEPIVPAPICTICRGRSAVIPESSTARGRSNSTWACPSASGIAASVLLVRRHSASAVACSAAPPFMPFGDRSRRPKAIPISPIVARVMKATLSIAPVVTSSGPMIGICSTMPRREPNRASLSTPSALHAVIRQRDRQRKIDAANSKLTH